MADHENDETDSSGASTRPAGTSSVPRTKPVIEGHAEEVAVSAPGDEAERASEQETPGDIFSRLVTPSRPEAAEPPPEAPHPPIKPPRRGGFVWPTVAIVIAVLAALGGAFGLHRLDKALDKTPARVAALDARVAALEQRPDPAEALRAAETGLEQRIVALEAANRDAGATIAGLRADLDKLAAQKAAASPSAAPEFAPLTARVAMLEEKLAALDTKVGGVAAKLDLQKSQVRASEDRTVQSAAARADNEAVAILAASLLRKVDSGAPYATDLAALANRGADKGKLAPLEPLAEAGVPTPPALAKQFSDLSGAILATEPPPKDNGLLNHVLADAARLVRIHKVGDTSGDDLAGRVARIQAALEAADVETAYAQWSGLPDAAKAKSGAFGTAAKGRIDALAAAQTIDSEAVIALAKAKS